MTMNDMLKIISTAGRLEIIRAVKSRGWSTVLNVIDDTGLSEWKVRSRIAEIARLGLLTVRGNTAAEHGFSNSRVLHYSVPAAVDAWLTTTQILLNALHAEADAKEPANAAPQPQSSPEQRQQGQRTKGRPAS